MKYICLIFIFSFEASAVIVKLSDLQTMAKRSDVVIHGYVGDQQVVEDKMGRLITLTSIEVIDGMYGAKNGEIIQIYQVGGQKAGLVMPLLGGHKYNFGQELILFGLKLDKSYVSYGAGQGKLDIDNKNTPEGLVTEDLGNVSTIDNSVSRGGGVAKPMPLSFVGTKILKDEIRKMLQNR